MKQNQLYFIIGALAAAVIGLGAYFIYEQTRPSGVEIRLDETGVSVEEN